MSNDKPLVVKTGPNAPGVLITFEGGDGSGKSTHIRFLARMLERLGFDVLCTREPGGTEIGEELRSIVLDAGHESLSDRAELLIYEAARAQLVEEVIKPTLDYGGIVLCDRFTDSTLAYQGAGRGLDCSFIRQANAFAAYGIVPDCTIVLSANRTEKRNRVDRRQEKDRLELAGNDFHTRVIESFAKLAEEDPERVFLVDTSGKHSETARKIFAVLSKTFPWFLDGSMDFSADLDQYDAEHVH